MGKTSPLSGTDKKFKRSEQKFIKGQRKIFEKEQKRERHFNRETQRELRAIQKGEGLPKYQGKEKFEIAKYKPKTEFKEAKYNPKASYEKQTLHGLNKDFERASKGAEKIFAPTREAAISDFKKYTQPSIAAQYTGGGTATSSAARQANASAMADLQGRLAANFAGLQADVANNQLTRREQSRQFGAGFQNQQEQFGAAHKAAQNQFGAQFGNQQEQFGASHAAAQNQFGAQYRSNQEQFGNQSQLANLNAKLQASGLLRNQTVQPQYTGLSASPSYNQPAPGGASGAANAVSGLAQGGGAALTAWWLAKAAAAPATGGASLAIPV